MHQGEWQRLAWLFWIIVMPWPEKLANNLSLGNWFFWKFWQWSQVFLWQVILFLYKTCLKSQSPERGQHWAVSLLRALSLSFPENSLPQRASSLLFPTPQGIHAFLFSPKFTHLFVLFCKLGQSPKNDSVDLWLVTAHTLCNAFHFFGSSLPPPDADDSATILRRISGDTSPDSHLWTWRIMTQLSAATQNQWLFLNIHI